jgi:hypothetical protein
MLTVINKETLKKHYCKDAWSLGVLMWSRMKSDYFVRIELKDGSIRVFDFVNPFFPTEIKRLEKVVKDLVTNLNLEIK